MEKISAIILTYNEEKNIQDAIESCAFADEIIVVDSFSSDQTVELAAKMPKVRVLQRKFINHANQKNWAIPQASNEWVFVLDADERTTSDLVKEILCKIKENPKQTAFWIPRTNIFMDKMLRFTWKGDAVIRLFRRDLCRYEDKRVHEEIVSDGPVGRLKNSLIHDTYSTHGYEGYMNKIELYSTRAAYDKQAKVKTVTLYHLCLKPAFRFFKQYIIKRGMMDGKQGFVISVLSAWVVFLRNLKIWRMQQGEVFEEK